MCLNHSNKMTSPTIVKIAVKMESEPDRLFEFNQKIDLCINIKKLCYDWGIVNPDQYAFMFENEEKYVTDQNRNEIINGSFLILTCCPSKMASDLIQELRTFSDGSMKKRLIKNFNLQKLSKKCTDKTFSRAFIAQKGLDLLISFIERDEYQGLMMLADALASFINVMKHNIVPWNNLETSFILKIVKIAIDPMLQEVMTVAQYSISILKSIVLECNDKHGLIKKSVGFPNQLMRRLENENLKLNWLSLLNALFLKAGPNAQNTITDVLFDESSGIIFQKILTADVGPEMAHQFYVTQTLYLNLLAERMYSKIDPLDQSVMNKLKELSKIEFELDLIGGGNPNEEHLGPFVIENKLGFTDEENPALDFTSTPPGMLAFDCMVYFADHHKEDYTKVILENSCRTDKHECPIGRSSVEIVRVLCKQFKIGAPPSEHKTKYFPFILSHKYSFHELYCICIKYASKLWREMRATAEDFNKVLNIVMSQVACAMISRPEPTNFENLSLKVFAQTYDELKKQWQLENDDKIKQGSCTMAKEKLVELVKPEIIELIKKQRLNFMLKGSIFIKNEQRGGQENYWFVRLSRNHKFFYYDDCDGSMAPVKGNLQNTMKIADIESLSIGHPQITNVLIIKGRKAQNIFSLTMKSSELQPICFITPIENEKAHQFWIDGINALIGNEMTSEEAKNDYIRLLTMEIQLRSLEAD